MYRRILAFLLLSFVYVHLFGQAPVNEKAEKLAKQNITYYWIGKSCPKFANTESAYGFKIQCVGCIITKPIQRTNRKAERKINRVYGKNWFDNNRNSFSQNN